MIATPKQAAQLLRALADDLDRHPFGDPLDCLPMHPGDKLVSVVETLLHGPEGEHDVDDLRYLKRLGAPVALVGGDTTKDR